MNILFLTLVRFENLKTQSIYTDLIKEFKEHGHNMYIMQPLERRFGMETQLLIFDEVNILNVRVGNITKTNLIEKGISIITLQNQFKKALNKYFKYIEFDLVLYTTPPITFGKVVAFIKKKQGSKTYLILKDIFPQNAVDINLISKRNPIYWYFRFIEKQLYQLSDYIGCMSKANVDYVINNNKSIIYSNVEVCPNSITPIDFKIDFASKEKIRNEYNLPLDKTIFIYGGNLGKPQGVDFIIDCLDKNENNSDAFILIVGSGTEYSKLKKYFDIKRPVNSRLINQVDKEKYETLVHSCDVGLIFLDKRFTIPNFPSRLLSYMQASLPVVAATDKNTDIGNIITNNEFGFWCESNSVDAFNSLLLKLCDKKIRNQMGIKGKNYLLNNYTSKHTYDIIMSHFNNQEESNVQR